MLQLAAHDFFNVDRGDFVTPESATEHEDGKLNLSTLLDHGDENIIRGGESTTRSPDGSWKNVDSDEGLKIIGIQAIG